jgi:hypothetical protein
MGKIGKILMIAIAALLMIGFYAVPIMKLREVDMTIVVLIGLGAMVWNFVETIRGED